MGIAGQHFSYQAVQQLIHDREIPQRSKSLDRSMVEAVFLYGAIVGSRIERYRILSRGMEKAREIITACEATRKSFPSGVVILAEELRDGRGRFQRHWHAPCGGLWLTAVLVNTLQPAATGLYPLAAGIACCETLRDFGIDARIKWINDVHVNNRKICGILCESFCGKQSSEEYVLIGIGLNVNNLVFPQELQELAVSMKKLTGQDYDVEEVITCLLAKLTWNLGLLSFSEESSAASMYDRAGGPEPTVTPGLIINRWKELSDTIGRKVAFGFNIMQKVDFEAEIIDITPRGSLILRHLADNAVTVENSGEIRYID